MHRRARKCTAEEREEQVVTAVLIVDMVLRLETRSNPADRFLGLARAIPPTAGNEAAVIDPGRRAGC